MWRRTGPPEKSFGSSAPIRPGWMRPASRSARTSSACASPVSNPHEGHMRSSAGTSFPQFGQSAIGGSLLLRHGNVDGPAARTLHAHLLRHLHRVHRCSEHVPTRDAHVVVGSVAGERGPVDVLLHGRAGGERHLAGTDLAHHDLGHHIVASLPAKSLINPSSTPTI